MVEIDTEFTRVEHAIVFHAYAGENVSIPTLYFQGIPMSTKKCLDLQERNRRSFAYSSSFSPQSLFTAREIS